MDASPVFEEGEDILYFVALSVELFVEVGRGVAALSWRDAWHKAFGFQRSAVFIAVVAFVTDYHAAARWKRRIEQLCVLLVAHLPFGQEQRNWPTLAIADGMELRFQLAFGASDTSGLSPFLNRLEAVLWALR